MVLEQGDGIRFIVALLSIGDQSPHVGTCFLGGGSFFDLKRLERKKDQTAPQAIFWGFGLWSCCFLP